MMNESKISFDEAFEAVKAGTIFTVHTPVRAGVDEFSTELMHKYFGDYAATSGNRHKTAGFAGQDTA